ncbi:unnamed protein product [Sympodiomycopsis kandeliae]
MKTFNLEIASWPELYVLYVTNYPTIMAPSNKISSSLNQRELYEAQLKDSNVTHKRRAGGGGGGGGGGRGGGGSTGGSSGGSRGGSSGGSGGKGSTGSTSSGRSVAPSSSRGAVGAAYGGGIGYSAGYLGYGAYAGHSYPADSNGDGVTSFTLPADSPFAGRRAGGGLRLWIHDSPRFGSGFGPSNYYGNQTNTANTTKTIRGDDANVGLGGSVKGFGFPYIYWPIWWGASKQSEYNDYYGSSEYNITGRPGGDMSLSVLKIPEGYNQTLNNFALFGDSASVITIKNALIDHCQVVNTTVDNFAINPNQAVQYYRASSFALLLEGYNNSQPLTLSEQNINNPNYTINTPVAPLPTNIESGYMSCLNYTIGTYLPLPYKPNENSAFSSQQPFSMVLFFPVFLMIWLSMLF